MRVFTFNRHLLAQHAHTRKMGKSAHYQCACVWAGENGKKTTNIFRMHAQFKINCQTQKNTGKMTMTRREKWAKGAAKCEQVFRGRCYAYGCVCVCECPGCALKYACRKLKLIIYIFKAHQHNETPWQNADKTSMQEGK